jgi:hypothetical protein
MASLMDVADLRASYTLALADGWVDQIGVGSGLRTLTSMLARRESI